MTSDGISKIKVISYENRNTITMNENGITQDEYTYIKQIPMAYIQNRRVSLLNDINRNTNVRARLGGKNTKTVKALVEARLLECVQCNSRDLMPGQDSVHCHCGNFALKKDIVSGHSGRVHIVKATKSFSYALRTKMYDCIIHEKHYRETARERKLRRFALKREENALISCMKSPQGSVRKWNNMANLGIVTAQIWYEDKATQLSQPQLCHPNLPV